jgi:tetratricopeptide (TPR) repeat protein
LRNRALLALEAGDQDTAFALGRQAMRLAPENPQVVFLNAMILGQRNRFPEAIDMLDKLAANTPDIRLPALGQTADWMVRYGQWDQAEERYLAILNQVPNAAIGHRNLAQLLTRQGRRIEAAKHLRFLCRLGDVTEEELRSLLSLVHPFEGDVDNDLIDPIGALGSARNDIGQGAWQSARQRLESVRSIQPTESALLGRIEAHLGDFEALQKWTVDPLNESDAHADAWFARGVHAAQQGEHPRAVLCFVETVIRDQTDHQAYWLMSQSLTAVDASEEAKQASSRAELIKQTQELGAAMALNQDQEAMQMTKLVDLLDQLQRPFESLAWRGMQLANAQSRASLSDAELEQSLADLVRDRTRRLNTNLDEATRQFIACGIDLEAMQRMIEKASSEDSPPSD